MMLTVIYICYFLSGIRVLFPILDIQLKLTDEGFYDLIWTPVESYPNEKMLYLIDYILNVKGKNGPRQRIQTDSLQTPIMYQNRLLTPKDLPTLIRGVVTVRSDNARDSPPHYFDLPFNRNLPDALLNIN